MELLSSFLIFMGTILIAWPLIKATRIHLFIDKYIEKLSDNQESTEVYKILSESSFRLKHAFTKTDLILVSSGFVFILLGFGIDFTIKLGHLIN